MYHIKQVIGSHQRLSHRHTIFTLLTRRIHSAWIAAKPNVTMKLTWLMATFSMNTEQQNKKSKIIQKQLKTQKNWNLFHSVGGSDCSSVIHDRDANPYRGHWTYCNYCHWQWMECAVSVCYAVGAADMTAGTEAVNIYRRGHPYLAKSNGNSWNWLRSNRTFCWTLEILNFTNDTEANAYVSHGRRLWDGANWPNWLQWMRWDRKRFAMSACILLAFASDYYTVYWALVGLQQPAWAATSCCVWCAHTIASMIEMWWWTFEHRL